MRDDRHPDVCGSGIAEIERWRGHINMRSTVKVATKLGDLRISRLKWCGPRTGIQVDTYRQKRPSFDPSHCGGLGQTLFVWLCALSPIAKMGW